MEYPNSVTNTSSNSLFRGEATALISGYFDQKYRVNGLYNRCVNMELNTTECFEAYGQYRGNRYCRDYLSDYRECTRKFLSTSRLLDMDDERLRQALAGERGWNRKDFYGRHVPRDSYISGPYTPS